LAGYPTAARQAAKDGPTTDFNQHTTRRNDARQRHAGRSVDSGIVEGSAWSLTGERRKQAGAKWKVAYVPMTGALGWLTDNSCWSASWKAPLTARVR
jgi:hypothetical protein